MQSNTTTGLKETGLTEKEATEVAVFGVDAKGRKHRFHTGRSTIIVTRDDDVVHVEQLAREKVPEWIDYVQDNVEEGWVDVWWSTESIAEGFSRSQEAYRTADELVCDGGPEQ